MVRFLLCFVVLAGFAAAEISREQRLQDFRQLASLYAKHYAPYEWKKEVQRFDLLQIGPWLDRVARAKDDLEFYDICIEYVASLNDAHDVFTLTSDFSASLGFSTDLWDNAIVVDSVNRTRLPPDRYPIQIGDELISIDGVPAERILFSLAKYATAANNRSTARQAAAFLTSRPQSRIPRAVEVPAESVIVLRSPGGEEKTLTIPWVRSGTPLAAGPVPSPKPAVARAASEASYLEPLRALQNLKLDLPAETVIGVGARNPVFTMPAGFTQRLGRQASDFFFSGTYEAYGVRLGFLRIPNYSPSSQTLALMQFAQEIQFFEANTDGLIIDNTRNPGGSACYLEALMSYLIPQPFRTLAFQIRATNSWIVSFSSSLTSARAQGAPPEVISQLEAILKELQEANARERGMTAPLPLCALSLDVQPARDRQGNVLAYTKPAMVLADDFSASGGDAFAAIFQDNRRGPVLGFRTMGAGGSVVSFTDVGVFGEGATRVTVSLMNRKEPVLTDDFRAVPYVENVGVRPDIPVDYMIRENLMNGGRSFVESFTWFMAEHVKNSR